MEKPRDATIGPMYDRRLGLSLAILVSAMAGTAHQSVPTMISRCFGTKGCFASPPGLCRHGRPRSPARSSTSCLPLACRSPAGVPDLRGIGQNPPSRRFLHQSSGHAVELPELTAISAVKPTDDAHMSGYDYFFKLVRKDYLERVAAASAR